MHAKQDKLDTMHQKLDEKNKIFASGQTFKQWIKDRNNHSSYFSLNNSSISELTELILQGNKPLKRASGKVTFFTLLDTEAN